MAERSIPDALEELTGVENDVAARFGAFAEKILTDYATNNGLEKYGSSEIVEAFLRGIRKTMGELESGNAETYLEFKRGQIED